ncbi:hypothetical protein PM082_002412 [Marasmius tenuissimus]|nr:hypothetical protein PM082_002412 [Marasmius tenuissimus]
MMFDTKKLISVTRTQERSPPAFDGPPVVHKLQPSTSNLENPLVMMVQIILTMKGLSYLPLPLSCTS